MHETVTYSLILTAHSAQRSRRNHNPCLPDRIYGSYSMETKRGFLPWQPGDGVLNFFDRVLALRHSLIFLRLRIAVEQFHQCLNPSLVQTVFAAFQALRRSTMPPCLPPDTLLAPICVANILPPACLSAWTRANPAHTLQRSLPPASQKLADRWPSRA